MTTPAPWNTSDLIRNLKTGELFMVLHIVKGYASLICPLQDSSDLPQTLTLFPRQYPNFVKDSNAVLKKGAWQSDRIVL